MTLSNAFFAMVLTGFAESNPFTLTDCQPALMEREVGIDHVDAIS